MSGGLGLISDYNNDSGSDSDAKEDQTTSGLKGSGPQECKQEKSGSPNKHVNTKDRQIDEASRNNRTRDKTPERKDSKVDRKHRDRSPRRERSPRKDDRRDRRDKSHDDRRRSDTDRRRSDTDRQRSDPDRRRSDQDRHDRDRRDNDRRRHSRDSRDERRSGDRYHRSRGRARYADRDVEAENEFLEYRRKKYGDNLDWGKVDADSLKDVKTDSTLPSAFDSTVAKQLAAQREKRKLLWGGSKKEGESSAVQKNVWGSGSIKNDESGEQTAKFLKLMGVKDVTAENVKNYTTDESVLRSSQVVESFEEDYEKSRYLQHMNRGVGLGMVQFSVKPQPPS